MSLLLPLLPRPMSRGRLDGLRYHLLSLGCPKNTVNSAYMEGLLERDGMTATFVAGDADVVIVKTCGFLQRAAQESIDALLELGELKPAREQRARLHALLQVQRDISARRNARWVGRELDVLVERVDEQGAAGRSFRDAPEIDGTVVVRSPEPPALDRFVRVRVEADAYTLRATASGSPW